jgi:hypothetical protein
MTLDTRCHLDDVSVAEELVSRFALPGRPIGNWQLGYVLSGRSLEFDAELRNGRLSADQD